MKSININKAIREIRHRINTNMIDGAINREKHTENALINYGLGQAIQIIKDNIKESKEVKEKQSYCKFSRDLMNIRDLNLKHNQKEILNEFRYFINYLLDKSNE